METQEWRFHLAKKSLSSKLYKQQEQPPPPPPLKKLKTSTDAKSSVQFCFRFRIDHKYKFIDQKLDGDLITVGRKKAPTVIMRFIEDPHYFKYTNELQRSVAKMLIKIGFDRIGASEHFKSDLIQRISNQTCQILNSVCNMGRPILSLSIDVTYIEVFVHYELDDITEQVMRRSEIEASERLNMVPASRKSIDELEKLKFDSGNSIINNMCTICFDEFETGLQVTRMPCWHGFHGKCITHWLEKSHFCPICRFEMPVY